MTQYQPNVEIVHTTSTHRILFINEKTAAFMTPTTTGRVSFPTSEHQSTGNLFPATTYGRLSSGRPPDGQGEEKNDTTGHRLQYCWFFHAAVLLHHVITLLTQ